MSLRTMTQSPSYHAKPTKIKSQRRQFVEAAHELGCDDDKDAFEAKLKQIAKAKRVESKPKRHVSKAR